MQNSRAKTIRGLSIAVVILAVLSILGLLIGLAFTALFGAAMADPHVQSSISVQMDGQTTRELAEYGMTGEDAMGILSLIFGLGAVYFVWGIICSIVALIAGIIGIRNCANIEKLGGAFGWAIAGAVFSFLYGNIVTCVLLIISAVCISRDRKQATAIPYGQPAAYTQPQYYAPQQPQQPVGQPMYAPQPQAQQPQPQQPQAAPAQAPADGTQGGQQ